MITALDGETEVLRHADENEPFSALAFKIQTDQHLGKLTYLRIYSGKIETGAQTVNSTKDRKERIGKIYQMHSNKREEREGAGAGEIIAVAGATLERDECIRADSTLEKLAALKPVFRGGGTVTAGNASPMNDGAAALVLASEAGARQAGASPLARVVSRATSGVEPHFYGIGPVEAARRALAAAGIEGSQLGAVIVATVTHLEQTPALATIIADRIGATPAAAYDISAACAGYW